MVGGRYKRPFSFVIFFHVFLFCVCKSVAAALFLFVKQHVLFAIFLLFFTQEKFRILSSVSLSIFILFISLIFNEQHM